MIWRKRIPPTGPEKLNLEESQNKSESDFYDLYRTTFEKSELGRIKKLLPLHEMAENFGLVSESMKPKLGRKSYFTPEGKVALMFLKIVRDTERALRPQESPGRS